MQSQRTRISSQVLRQRLNPISLRRGYYEGQKGGDIGHDKTHVTDKHPADSKLNVQSGASQAGREEKAAGSTHSQATSQKDLRKNSERAKKEYPEAPEPIIGMSDERGTKGH